jgi:hypothetical protein
MHEVPKPNAGAVPSVSPAAPAALMNLRRVISMSHWYAMRVPHGSAKCEASTQMGVHPKMKATLTLTLSRPTGEGTAIQRFGMNWAMVCTRRVNPFSLSHRMGEGRGEGSGVGMRGMG